MKESIQNPIYDTVIRFFFVALYGYTAFMKWADFDLYRIKMYRQVFPDWFTEVMIYSLPVVEIGVATLLIMPFFGLSRWFKISSAANLLLISSFTLYAWMAMTKVFGYIPCACGGFLEKLKWPEHFKVNLALTILAAVGVCLQHWKTIRLKWCSACTYLFGKTKGAHKV